MIEVFYDSDDADDVLTAKGLIWVAKLKGYRQVGHSSDGSRIGMSFAKPESEKPTAQPQGESK